MTAMGGPHSVVRTYATALSSPPRIRNLRASACTRASRLPVATTIHALRPSVCVRVGGATRHAPLGRGQRPCQPVCPCLLPQDGHPLQLRRRPPRLAAIKLGPPSALAMHKYINVHMCPDLADHGRMPALQLSREGTELACCRGCTRTLADVSPGSSPVEFVKHPWVYHRASRPGGPARVRQVRRPPALAEARAQRHAPTGAVRPGRRSVEGSGSPTRDATRGRATQPTPANRAPPRQQRLYIRPQAFR
jgi:hypothetical protein